MVSLFHAGLVAAARQLGAVAVVTLSVSLLASHDLIVQEASATGRDTDALWFVSPLLVWAYLLIATGLALSAGRSIFHTAGYFRRASCKECFVSPLFVLKTLVAEFSLLTICLAVFALRRLNQ
jgi:hypothetical protein